MSRQVEDDVRWEDAARDWLDNHAREWRKDRLGRDMADQLGEMLRHKWIESEKAGRDLGNEALIDWVNKYAAHWRKTRR